MSIEPSIEEQQLLAETFERAQSRMSKRERRAELLVAAGFVAAVAALCLIRPPGGFAIGPALVCLAVMVIATRVRFDTPLGFTVATQLAFVPLLFALPVAVVPVAVVLVLAVARLPELLRRQTRARSLGLAVGNAWFAVGPAAVFALAHTDPSHASPALLVIALGAQFAVDFGVSALRFGIDREATLRTQLRETWVYGIDAALSPIGLLAAYGLRASPIAALAPVPLLGLLAMFARERHGRLQQLLELGNAYRGTALVLGDVVQADDGYTGEHSKGVVVLTLAVADRLNLRAERRRNLEFAALLHDVGKIAIPKEIINKPGKLDPSEWTIIKTHTIEGQRMLDRVGGFMRDVGLIVRSHHERWDGTGYPDGLTREAIPLEARIVACCDTWNAMRTDRVYRKALPYEVALAELRASAGSQLDPDIVATLESIVTQADAENASPETSSALACDPYDSWPVDPETPEAGTPEAGAPQGAAGLGQGAPKRWLNALRERRVGGAKDRGSRRPLGPVSDSPATRSGEHDDHGPARLWGVPLAADGTGVDDGRAADPVQRLLEDSWDARRQRAGRRELIVEGAAAALFLAIAVPLALPTLLAGRLPLGMTLLLVGLYAVVARTIKFPVGAGYVVPSYLVLVPMLLLLPPAAVPLLIAVALVIGAGLRVVLHRGSADEVLFSVADAWHALGPALVLSLAGDVHGLERIAAYVAALLAGFLVDLVASTMRESLAQAIAPQLQGRVIAVVWLVDSCLAPVGWLIALAAKTDPAALLLVAPLIGLAMVVDRDRSMRIAEAQRRLDLVARERTRLQAAVHRLGDSFAAKLDLRALTGVLLGGSIDALDADGGSLSLQVPGDARVRERVGDDALESLLAAAREAAQAQGGPCQVEARGAWALSLPLGIVGGGTGALAVARHGRAFRDDELALMRGLVERAERAAAEILAHEALREQAMTDPLTRLGNRRRLAEELGEMLPGVSVEAPLLLMLFDLDGFKSYNDTFGHVAGDALLARLGHKLAGSVSPQGSAYRLGGDEFCVLLPARRENLQDAIAAAAGALEEHGETFAISASCGTVLLPHEATTADYALQLADKRMYARKHGRSLGAREQAHDVLLHIIRAKQPDLPDHANGVARYAVAVGRRMGMHAEQLDELGRAASLHDVGKVGLPDAVLNKTGPLDAEEWDFVRQHTVLGERILSAAPALRPVATIVRASHERWDGGGYPDGLAGEEIPLGARIVAVCDAYQAITSDRSYRPAHSGVFAREELCREAGRQFDPAVVAAFLKELDEPSAPAPGQAPASGEEERATNVASVVSHVHDLLELPYS